MHLKSIKLKLLLVITAGMFASEVKAQDAFSVGPMLHYNFGSKKPKISWGVEAAVWWYENGFPVSGNFGFDRRKGSTALYTQVQTGVGVVGVAAGPYVEFRKEESAILGFQTDYWLNYYAGLNYRIRYNPEQRQKALGVYAKLPLDLGPEEENNDDIDWDWD
ncbi:hypothetical protein [Pontibacter vulgaris]|uniref:hypothetical protein n=1 Tax=Pontibacter vulgaris TaxID=2905679 RepID=UPI001FA78ED1|nr:hypothetical protein [Pontibacter vulgaris]